MSLTTPTPIKTYNLGIIASKSFDDRDLIPDIFLGKVSEIEHVYTNGVSPIVLDWCTSEGIPYTVYPIVGGKTLPWSLSNVIDASAFILIIADENSKSAKQAVEACVKKGKKYKFVSFEPAEYWREKLCKVAEVIAVMTPEDKERNGWVKAIEHII